MKMIEYILFDLAEVCVRGILGVEKEIAKLSGFDAEHVKRLLKGEKGRNLDPFFEGRQSEEEYLSGIVEESGLSMEAVKSLIRNYFTEIPGTSDIIKRLKKRGYKVGLLSDHSREWIEHIEAKFPFMELFDERCYSFESGYTKTVPQSFWYALIGLNADAAKTLFIDDYQGNLDVAKKAGIAYVHQFVDAPSLEKSLVNFGLL